MMKKYLSITFILLLCSSLAFAQQAQTVKLTPGEVEAVFLQQNLQLIAERMNIDIADAAIAQARLWENPSLSISDISFWSSKSQRDGESEVIPPLFGSFAHNTQFSVELSQLIQTAGKRSKLVNMEKVSKEIALQEFEDVLRGLKTELRKSINEIVYTQAYQKVLEKQTVSLTQLINAYDKQVKQGNISINELLRLQSALLELENENNEVQTEINAQQKNLKALLNADPFVTIEISESNNILKSPAEIALAKLMDTAFEHRPDLQAARLQTQYHEKSLAYEKAQRAPDVTLSANYDRWGGVWKNFVGVGISVDLPVLNRNQGNIKAAKISREQSEHLAQYQENIVQHEIAEAYSNYTLSYDFHKKIENNPLFAKLDEMLEAYTKNLLNRNISMLEYVDFMESYKANKQTILSAKRNTALQFEELQFTVGTELK